MAGRASRRGKANPPDNRPASPAQLWRLHEQGLLRLVDDLDDEELWQPGGPKDRPADWSISAAQADELIQRLLAQRWRGLARFPRAGDGWTVDKAKGLVRLSPSPKYDAAPALTSDERKAALNALVEFGKTAS